MQQAVPKRNFNLMEYQSKDILSKAGVAVQKFVVVNNKAEISKKVNSFSKSYCNHLRMKTEFKAVGVWVGRIACYIKYLLFSEVKEYVVKAQVFAGGRGKGHFDTGFKSGVHITKE